MANATEDEPTDSTLQTRDSQQPPSPPPPPPPPPQQSVDASATSAIQVKKERKCDTPVQQTPQVVASGCQDEQLRLLLQQTGVPAGSSSSSLSFNRPGSTAAVSGRASVVNGNQRTIDSFFAVKNKVTGQEVDPTLQQQEEERKTPPVDLESVRGMFGWTTLERVHIPFILRGDDRFTAVRIIEKTLLKKFLQALPPEVYSCTYIKSYFITDNEAKLLNEINMKHCDRQYGSEIFSTKDLVVLLNDVEQLYQFLSTCYHKLGRPSSSQESQSSRGRCGIVKVEGSAIPYVMRNDVRYVPLSLFDQGSVMKALDLKTEKMESWEMSYFKFCCKVARISHDFLQQDSCLVVSVDDLQQTLKTKFTVEEWWPSALSFSNSNQTQTNVLQSVKSETKDNNNKYSAMHQRMMVVKSEAAQSNGVKCKQQTAILPRAVPASGYYDPRSGMFTTDPVRGPISREQLCNNAAATANSSRGGGSSSENAAGGTPVPPSASTSLASSYNLPDLLPPSYQMAPTLPLSKLQAYLYSGQYWGGAPSYLESAHPTQMPMVYSAETSAYGNQRIAESSGYANQRIAESSAYGNQRIAESSAYGNQRLAESSAYANQRIAESSAYANQRIAEHTMNGRTSSSVMPSYSGEALYTGRRVEQSINGGRSNMVHPGSRLPTKSSYTLPMSNNQVGSAMMLPPMLQVNSDMLPRDHHRELKTHEEQRSPFYPDGQYRGLPKVAGSDHTVARSILNGSNEASTLTSANAKHLLDMNRAAASRLENFVVAPAGNVQSLAGKMSSPKPANQVPAHVSNYHNFRHSMQMQDLTKTISHAYANTAVAAVPSSLLSAGKVAGVSSSKLQQLLSNSNVDAMEPQDLSIGSRSSTTTTPSRSCRSTSSHVDAGGYEVQHLNVSGIKFRAIVTVMSHSKGLPMVPLAELEKRISPHIQAEYYEHILTQGLGVRLYNCSRGQADILKKYVHCSNEDKCLLLICGDDLKRCLPHLQQITRTMTKLRTPAHMGDVGVQTKRMRLETEAVT